MGPLRTPPGFAKSGPCESGFGLADPQDALWFAYVQDNRAVRVRSSPNRTIVTLPIVKIVKQPRGRRMSARPRSGPTLPLRRPPFSYPLENASKTFSHVARERPLVFIPIRVRAIESLTPGDDVQPGSNQSL